jgi:crossover junction endodeoxyribonuclease RuvC
MRILGIDPGSTVTGYGVVECEASRLVHVAHGTLRPNARDSLPLRLASLQASLQEVIELHQPEVASVEQVFVSASARSALVLGHARGVLLAAAARAGLPVAEYAARQIKQAVTGTGAAPKAQVQTMVRRLLELERRPAQDAADGLAAAICHAHSARWLGLGGRASPRRRTRRSPTRVVRRAR